MSIIEQLIIELRPSGVIQLVASVIVRVASSLINSFMYLFLAIIKSNLRVIERMQIATSMWL